MLVGNQQQTKETPLSLAEMQRRLRHKEREVYSIQRIGKALSSTLKLDELLRLIMQEITTLMDADRSTLYIADHQRREIWSKIALKAEVKEIRQQFGKGISGYVAETGKVINIADAYNDERFDPATDKRTGYRTRSILCMRVWEPHAAGEERRVIAVIQVLNKREGHFTEEDEALLEALSSQVAISIANARLYQRLEQKYRELDLLYELEQMLSAFSQFPVIVKQLLERAIGYLQAEWVFTVVPAEAGYLFCAYHQSGEHRFEKVAAVSREWQVFEAHPTAEQWKEQWETIRTHFKIEATPEFDPQSMLISHLNPGEDARGVLVAAGVPSQENHEWEDLQQMFVLIAQKIWRAYELYQLRENLVKQERLSTIGQLMSTIVHDIRGPVNTIYGFVDLMGDESTTVEERKEFAGIIRDEIKSTMNMITEVLDFAKGKTSILPRKSSVKNILERYKPRAQQMCQKNQTRLKWDVQSSQLLHVDLDKLNRVFYNLTKNALEAMGSGGEFTVKIWDEDDQVVFQFSDAGPGIPEELRAHLFDSFVTSGKESGTGLGLAIVQKIVREHKGRIEVESQPGQGATFRIYLPVYKKESG